VDDNLEQRIDNWARMWRYQLERHSTLSLEGAYRSPQPWEPAPVNAIVPVDVPDAWVVESAVNALPDIFYSALMRAWHVKSAAGRAKHWGRGRCFREARKIAYGPFSRFWRDFDEALADAHVMTGRALYEPLVIRREWARARIGRMLAL
jgi:hypothetical protein